MAKYVYDVVAKLPGKSEDKPNWVKCGAVFEGEKGLSVKMDTIPAAGWNGWLLLMKPKPKDQTGSQPAQTQQKKFDDDDAPY